MSRERDFKKITKALNPYSKFSNNKEIIVAEGDSLQLLKLLPNNCISLVLTDPPYHSTNKRNIYGDRTFKEDDEYLEWMNKFANEWQRILRPNGSMFCFCSSELSARLEIMFSKTFNIISQIVWTKPNDPGFDGWKQKMRKEALRKWYPHSERIIFAEPLFDENSHRPYFGHLLRKMRKKAGLTAKQLTEAVGAYGRVNHGGAVSNWETGRNIPSREQYRKICEALTKTEDIKSMPPYKDVIRKFSVNSSKEFTDVWDFPSVRPYKGKHPAEKPLSLLEHAIESTTYPKDIVLDCFAGSGSTALASFKLNRYSVSIEIAPTWIGKIVDKLKFISQNKKRYSFMRYKQKSSAKTHWSQKSLFTNSE